MPVGKSSIARAVSAKNAPAKKCVKEEAAMCCCEEAKKTAKNPVPAEAITAPVPAKKAAAEAKPAPAKKRVSAKHVIGNVSPEVVKTVRKGEESYAIGQELPRYLL